MSPVSEIAAVLIPKNFPTTSMLAIHRDFRERVLAGIFMCLLAHFACVSGFFHHILSFGETGQ